MFKSSSRFFKRVFLVYSIDGLSALAGIFFTKIAISRLGISDFGKMSIMLNLANLASVLFSFGLKGILPRLMLDKPIFKFLVAKIVLINSFLCAPFLAFILVRFFNYSVFDITLILLSALPISLFTIKISINQFYVETRKLVLNKALNSLIPVVLTSGLLYWGYGDYATRFVVLLPLLFVLLYELWNSPKLTSEKYFFSLRSGSAMFYYAISQMILSNGDSFIIEYVLNDEIVGYYLVHYKIANIITLLSLPMLTIRNGYFNKYKHGKISFKELKKYTMIQILTLLVLFIISNSFYTWLFNFFAPGVGHNNTLRYSLLLSTFMLGVVSMTIPFFIWHKLFKILSFTTVTVAILNCVMNFVFVPKYGIESAAIVTLSSYIILLIVFLMFIRNFQKNE